MGRYNNKFNLSKILVAVVLIVGMVGSCLAENLITTQSGIVFPLLAPRLSSGYGYRNHPIKKAIKHHNGVDLAAPSKSHVRAIAGGMIVYAGTLGGYGKIVTIKHADEYVKKDYNANDYDFSAVSGKSIKEIEKGK